MVSKHGGLRDDLGRTQDWGNQETWVPVLAPPLVSRSHQSLNHSSLGFHELSNGNNTHLLGLMERLEETNMSKYYVKTNYPHYQVAWVTSGLWHHGKRLGQL